MVSLLPLSGACLPFTAGNSEHYPRNEMSITMSAMSTAVPATDVAACRVDHTPELRMLEATGRW